MTSTASPERTPREELSELKRKFGFLLSLYRRYVDEMPPFGIHLLRSFSEDGDEPADVICFAACKILYGDEVPVRIQSMHELIELYDSDSPTFFELYGETHLRVINEICVMLEGW